MTDLKVAFWNVENLFHPSADVGRGPANVAELDEKIDVLAGVIDGFFGGTGPDLLALAEVGNETVFRQLVGRLTGDFDLRVWEPEGTAQQTGLGVAARSDRFADLRREAAFRPTVAARPRVLLVECSPTAAAEPFLFAVNHWKSRRPAGGPGLDAEDRREAARWLGDRVADEVRRPCVVVIGDFNDEPHDPPFNETHLRGVRTFSRARTSRGNLYNTAWRFLSEPDPWDVADADGYREPRPKTSCFAGTALMFDQLLVSGRALDGRPLRLRESMVDYVCTAVTADHVPTNGRLFPRRWRYTGPGDFAGASDHFPLVARFEIA